MKVKIFYSKWYEITCIILINCFFLCVSGTTERVCLITGSVDAILTVLDFIMEKIREKPDLTKPVIEAGDSKLTQERDKQVR